MTTVTVMPDGRVQAQKGDFTLGMYSNARGAHKQFSWIASLTAIAAEVFDGVRKSSVYAFTEKLKGATALAAPLAAMPEALTFGIKSVRSYVDLTAECTSKTIKKAFGNTVKCAQRAAESATALMKLNVIDAAGLVAAKFFKDGFACIIDVMSIQDAFATEVKVDKCANTKIKEIWQKENNCAFAKGVVGLAFHAMNVAGLLCAGVVTFHMVTAVASIYTVTVLSNVWYNIERTDLESEIAATAINTKMNSPSAS